MPQGEDLEFIASTLHPTIEPDLVKIMVEFLTELGNSAGGPVSRGDLPFAVSGGPWEFNLRDLLRWCQLVESTKNSVQPLSSKPVIDHVSTKDAIEHFLHVLFVHRLRTWEDRQKVVEIWQYASGSLLQGVTAGGFAQDYVKGVQLTPQASALSFLMTITRLANV